MGIWKLHLGGEGWRFGWSIFFAVFMFFPSLFQLYIFVLELFICACFFVLLFFTHPPLVGTLSRVLRRQTAGPSTCRLEGVRGGGLLTLSLSFAAVIVFDREAMVFAAFAEQEG